MVYSSFGHQDDVQALPGVSSFGQLLAKLFWPGLNVMKLFPSSLMMRPNELEDLPFETFSSQVL